MPNSKYSLHLPGVTEENTGKTYHVGRQQVSNLRSSEFVAIALPLSHSRSVTDNKFMRIFASY